MGGSGSFLERASTVLDVLWTRATCFGDGCRVVLTDSASKAGGAAYGSALAAWNQAMRYEGKLIYSLFQNQLGVFVPSFQRATQIEADFIFHRSFWLRNLTASPTAFSVLLSLLPPGLNFTSCYISDVKVSWAANPSSLWTLPIRVTVDSVVASAAEVPAGSEDEVEALITNWLAITNNQGKPCPFKGTYPLLDGVTFRVAHVELNITSPTRYGNVSLSLRDLEVSAVDAKGQARDLDLLCKSGLRGDSIHFHRLVECKEASILRQPDDTESHAASDADADAAHATSAEQAHRSGGGKRNRRRGVIWRGRMQRAWRKIRGGTSTSSRAADNVKLERLDADELNAVPSSSSLRRPARKLTQAEQDQKLKELLTQLPHPGYGLAKVDDDARVVAFTDWKASQSLPSDSERQKQGEADVDLVPVVMQEVQAGTEDTGGAALRSSSKGVLLDDRPLHGDSGHAGGERPLQGEALVNGQEKGAEKSGGGFSFGSLLGERGGSPNDTNGVPEDAELGEKAHEDKGGFSLGSMLGRFTGGSSENSSGASAEYVGEKVQEDKGGFGFHWNLQWPWSGDDEEEVDVIEGGPSSPSFQEGRRRRSLWFWKQHAEEHVDDEVVEDEDEDGAEDEVVDQYVIAPTPVQVLVTQTFDVNDMRRNLEQRIDFAFPGPFSGFAAPPLLTGAPELPPPDPRLHPFPGPSPTWSFKVVKRNPLWGKPYKKPLYRSRRGAITMTALACLVLAWLTTTLKLRPWVQTWLQRVAIVQNLLS